MNLPALVFAVGVAGAAVAVAGARDGRSARIGLVLVIGLAPALADPLPGPAAFAARIVGGLLAVVLLSGLDLAKRSGSRLGWPAETVLAVAGFVAAGAVALALADLGAGAGDAPGTPSPGATDLLARIGIGGLALGAGAAVLVTCLRAFLADADPKRRAMALVAVVQGLALVRTGLAGPPGAVEQLAVVAMTVAAAAAGSAVAAAAGRRGDRPARSGATDEEGPESTTPEPAGGRRRPA